MTTMSAPPQVAEPVAESDLLRHVHAVARDAGLLTGLRALVAALAPDGVPFGPAGHAVLPAGADTVAPARLLRTITIDGGELHAVAASLVEPAPAAWSVGVSWLRLGASRWLLRQATEHVAGRTVGTEQLIAQQMVKGMIAEALTEQLEAEALLDGATDHAVLIDANARIQAADRTLMRLFGASGFRTGPASATCWVSELLADAYIGYEITEGAS